jgi:hypothetical protein
MSETNNTDLYIAATADSPEVDFRFSTNSLSLKGESYPENAAAFYDEIIARTRAFLANGSGPVTIDVALAYFNSSSTKMLFNLFDTLNEAAERGTKIVLNWYHDSEDDTIQEFGQELHDDFAAIEFHARVLSN